MPEDLTQIAEASARGSFFLATGQTAALIVEAVAVFVVARLSRPRPLWLIRSRFGIAQYLIDNR